jgi:hypothetical protein
MKAVVFLLSVFAFHILQINGAVTCRAGYEKVTENMNDFCRLCPHPKYSDADSMTCSTCPAPKISHDGISCNFCDDGFGFDDELGDCIKCPAHHESVDGRCVPCSNGFTNTGSNSCILCPDTLIADLRLLRCRCEYGKEIGNMEECFQCPEAVPYSDGLTCKDCIGHAKIDSPDLSYGDHDHDHSEHDEADALFCSPCPFGEQFVIESGVCEACPDDQLSDGFVCQLYGYVMPNYFDANRPDFKPTCATCPSGHKMEQSGLGFNCVPCPKGYYQDTNVSWAGISTCTPCPPHTYQNDVGMTFCKPCMSNITDVAREAREGSAKCTPCRPGTYFDSATQFCTPCEKGMFQGNWGSRLCERCPLGEYTGGKTGQSQCQLCPGGTYGFIGADGMNSCRRCEKEAVIGPNGGIRFTFAIGNVRGAKSEEEANCQSPNTVWKTCETIAAEECSEDEYLVGCNTNSRGTCQNCTTVASTAGCVGRIQFCGGISAGCCGTENFECVETRGSAVMSIEPLHSFRFTADNESLYLSWLDGRVQTYSIIINVHKIDGTANTTIETVEGLSTSIRYGSPEFPCGSENPCLTIDRANEWVVNITIVPEGGSPVELENVLYSIDNRTFNLTDLAWVNIEDLIEYDVSAHITSINVNSGYEISFNNDNTVFVNPVIELKLGQTLAFFIQNIPQDYLFDFYNENETKIEYPETRFSIFQGIQSITPSEEGMFSYVSKDGSQKLKGLIRVGSDAMIFKWDVSPETAYIVSGTDRYNPTFVNLITPTIYAKSYDKIFVDFSENVDNFHPVEVISYDNKVITIFKPATSLPFFNVQAAGKYYYRCKTHPTNTFLQGNILVFDELHEVNISVYSNDQVYPYVLSGSDRTGNFVTSPQRDIQIQLGDLLVMNTVLTSQSVPQVIITDESGGEVSYIDLYNPGSVRWMPLYESSTSKQLFRYTCSSSRESELCPVDDYGNTRYRGLIYVGIPKDVCTGGSVPSSTGCQECLAGFRDATGDAENEAFKGQCLPCEAGTYQDQSAQTQCLPCAAGFYQNLSAQHECIACPVESFQNASGQTYCHPCPLSVDEEEGQTQCETTVDEPETEDGQTCEAPASRPANGVLVRTVLRNQNRGVFPSKAALQEARVAVIKLIRPRKDIRLWIHRIKVSSCLFASDVIRRRLLQDDTDLYIDYTIETSEDETIEIDSSRDDSILSSENLEPITTTTSGESTTTTAAESTTTTAAESSTTTTPAPTTTTEAESTTTTAVESTTTTAVESTTTTAPESTTTTTPAPTTTTQAESTTTTAAESTTTTTPAPTTTTAAESTTTTTPASTTTTAAESTTTTTPASTTTTAAESTTTTTPALTTTTAAESTTTTTAASSTTTPAPSTTTTTPTTGSDDIIIIAIAGGATLLFLGSIIIFILVRRSATRAGDQDQSQPPLGNRQQTVSDINDLPVIHLKIF